MCSPPNLSARIADRHHPQEESHARPATAARLLVGDKSYLSCMCLSHPLRPCPWTNLDRSAPASKSGDKKPGTFLPHPGWRAGSRDSSILRPRRNRAIQFPLHPLNCPLRRAFFFDLRGWTSGLPASPCLIRDKDLHGKTGCKAIRKIAYRPEEPGAARHITGPGSKYGLASDRSLDRFLARERQRCCRS